MDYDEQIARDVDAHLTNEEEATMNWDARSRELEQRLADDPALRHEIFVCFFMERQDQPVWLTTLTDQTKPRDAAMIGQQLEADWQVFLKANWSKLVEAYTNDPY